jgi:uncharacterized protein with GYD domain
VPRYVILLNWTEEGVASARDTVDRYRAAKQLLESKGGSFDAVAWTLGPYDLVGMATLPDDETAAAVTLQLAGAGKVRTQTMRGFDEHEMASIVAKLD